MTMTNLVGGRIKFLLFISLSICFYVPSSIWACDAIGTIKPMYQLEVNTNNGVGCYLWADSDYSVQIESLKNQQELAQLLIDKCLNDGTLSDNYSNFFLLKFFRDLFKAKQDEKTLLCQAKKLNIIIYKYNYKVVSDCNYEQVEQELAQVITETKKIEVMANNCNNLQEIEPLENSTHINDQGNNSEKIQDPDLKQDSPTIHQ